jgi:AcrR family transcriptional regulator
MNQRIESRAPINSSDTRGPATRTALLASARRLFARHGFDGASVRAITKEARANLGAVTYHFRSKRALYEATLESVLAPLARRVVAAAAVDGSSLQQLEGVVRAFFHHLAENPDMPQLMLQEIAAGKDPPTPVRRVLGEVSGVLVRLITNGQAAGEIRSGDPLLMALSCVYQPVHLTLVQRIARPVLGMDMADPGIHQRVVEHSVTFARAGLEARGGGR